MRFRMIPGSRVSLWIRCSVYLATFAGSKSLKAATITLPPIEHCRPAQTRLSAFKHQEFKMFAIVMGWHTPLVIVISDDERVLRGNPAASLQRHAFIPVLTVLRNYLHSTVFSCFSLGAKLR
jgi:hypothetical protein